jgi:benzoate-CoA ligase
VVAHTDAEGLARPRAFATLAPGRTAGDPLAEELRGFVRERLAPHKVPRTIVFVTSC